VPIDISHRGQPVDNRLSAKSGRRATIRPSLETLEGMTLFTWLCIAHLVGDWMLQNDWMARNKRSHPWEAACLIHCLVYTATLGVVYVWAMQRQGHLLVPGPALAFVLIIFTSHWLIDGWDLPRRWGVLVGQTDNMPVRIVVDQTMHIIVLALLVSI
jgi:hypothetical protein